MRTTYRELLTLGVLAALAATAGCGGDKTPGELVPPPVIEFAGFDALIATFDADLGEEGVPVDREEVKATLLADAELRAALLGGGQGS